MIARRTSNFCRLFLVATLAGLLAQRADGQVDANSELYKEIAAMDDALFGAFNRCDLEQFKEIFTDDIEFYRDKDGLAVGVQKQVEAVDKFCRSHWRVRRELVPGSMEIHPIPNFGAVQWGTHRFYETKKPDGKEKLVGIAKFLHVWQKTNNRWKVRRIISYDHHAATEQTK